MYEIDINEGDLELVKKLGKLISRYEKECLNKNKSSSPTEIKRMIEENCK